MTSFTSSELLFEKFCQMNYIRCKRIPSGSQKSPDYDIYLQRRKIIIEVKQIEPNREEQKKIREFRERKTVSIRYQLGKRVRNKITDTAGKFKKWAKGRYPSILVLYNNVRMYKHTEPRDILAGMYGQLYFPVTGRSGKPLKIGNIQSGSKKKMTPSANTSISAIAVLKKGSNGDPLLSVYHNLHAKVGLSPSLLSQVPIRQYWVNDSRNPTDWVEINDR